MKLVSNIKKNPYSYRCINFIYFLPPGSCSPWCAKRNNLLPKGEHSNNRYNWKHDYICVPKMQGEYEVFVLKDLWQKYLQAFKRLFIQEVICIYHFTGVLCLMYYAFMYFIDTSVFMSFAAICHFRQKQQFSQQQQEEVPSWLQNQVYHC